MSGLKWHYHYYYFIFNEQLNENKGKVRLEKKFDIQCPVVIAVTDFGCYVRYGITITKKKENLNNQGKSVEKNKAVLCGCHVD